MDNKEKLKRIRRDQYILFATFLLIAIVTLLLCSCRTIKQSTTDTKNDSTHVEIRYEKIFVPDTILVPLPPQTAERVTGDSVSHLENDYAISDARISEGLLFHTLQTKNVNIEVPVQKEIERHDSIIYKNKVRTITITKTEKKKVVPTWCYYSLASATVSVLAIAFIIYRKIRK